MTQKEKLKKISLFASLLFTQKEIELLLKSEDEITDEMVAYEYGRLNSTFNIRKALFTEAKNGSTAAIKEWTALEHKLEVLNRRKR